MPKRGRRKSRKLKIKNDTLKSIFALGLVLAGVLSLISVFTSKGTLLSLISKTQFHFVGNGVFLVPVILLLAALLLFDSIDWEFVQARVLFGVLLLLVSVSGLSSIVFSEKSGGKLGALLSQFLEGSVTNYGGALVLFVTLVIALILVFDVSLDSLFGALGSLTSKLSFSLPAISNPLGSVKPILRKDDFDTEEDDFAAPLRIQPKEPKKEKPKETTIEIIPSASEPVEVKSGRGPVLSGGKISPSSLPYTDKVWEYPPLELLSDAANIPADRGDVKLRQQIIEKTLASFGIKSRVAEINNGPAVTQYALETISGTKIAKVTNLQNDIALALASPTGSVRIEAPIPGKSLIGIEVPNITTAIVNFKSLLTSDVMKASKSKLTISLGHDVSGLPRVADISKMPHLLIAGSTGSGKSVFLHSVLFSLLYRCSPAECKLILVDPKRVELVNYHDIPHLLVPVITDAEKAPNAFRWAVTEMERRYKLFENAKVRNVNAYNELSGFQALPYIVIVVDELAELMALQPGEMERSICRLAQLSRATGIHLILSTQSPRVDVITGLIKANIPTRISFSVSSQIESRIIIDTVGAEKLLGKGDMLYVPHDTPKPSRIQGVFVSDKEIANLVGFLKNSGVKPEYKQEVLADQIPAKGSAVESSDELFDEAVNIISISDKASASLLQRKLSIGYARAARLLDELEEKGIIGPADGSKPRDVLKRASDSLAHSAQEDI